MSTEFVIGTILGIIGCISSFISFFRWMKKPNLSKLFNCLVDKNLPQKRRKKVLQRIDRRLRLAGRCGLKSDYIAGFILGKRGKEAVFEDLCLQNRLEPTPELCKMFLTVDSAVIRNRYYAQTSAASSPAGRSIPATLATAAVLAASSVAASAAGEADAVQPAEKRPVVCLSALLRERYPAACGRLTALLDKHGVAYRFLAGTCDIWCRDYMPVLTASGKLVQFRYDPSYLKGRPEWEQSRSDVHEICRLNGIVPDETSDINLDGGNVLLCGGRAVISDRMFSENPNWKPDDILAELARLLEAEIIIIPAQRDDMTGHADGMVRFIDRHTLLGNCRADEYKYWAKGIGDVLERHRLAYEDVPFFYDYKDARHPHHAIGIYVNYLEVGNLMIVPVFGVSGNKDAEALARFRELFPDRTIETIDYNEVALEGGLLNCTTWVYSE